MRDKTLLNGDGLMSCSWPGTHDDYRSYHDTEWGYPVIDDFALFEKLCLESFQAGLSWLTILRKRNAFRTAFENFDPNVVSRFDSIKIEALLKNKKIIRNKAKILSVINNAARALEVISEQGSLASYLWSFEPTSSYREPGGLIPASTPESVALAKNLKKRGWKFLGPTTVYSFMQAVGMVNDHIPECWVHPLIDTARERLSRPIQ